MNKKYTCPRCAGSNFSFNTTKLVGRCFNCGYSGAGDSLRKKLGAVATEYRPPVVTPSDFPDLTDPAREALSYLASRGIGKGYAKRVGIKWDGGDHIYLPVWAPATGTNAYVRRNISGSGGRYYNDGTPGVAYVLGEQKNKRKDMVVLVEGPFDLLSPGLWGVGYSLLGSELYPAVESWLKRQGFGRISVWFDPDDTGITKGAKVASRLRRWHPNVVLCNGWAFDSRDPGDYARTEAASVLHQAYKTKLRMPYKWATTSR